MPTDRVAEIRAHETAADEAEETVEFHRWEAARLIVEELDSGKSQRQLAGEIGKNEKHVRLCRRVWQECGPRSAEDRPRWNVAYQAAKGTKAPPPPPPDEEPEERDEPRREYREPRQRENYSPPPESHEEKMLRARASLDLAMETAEKVRDAIELSPWSDEEEIQEYLDKALAHIIDIFESVRNRRSHRG